MSIQSEREQRTKAYCNARFGMFIHWGLYAIPARGEWVRSYERISNEEYQQYFDEFNPTNYDPKKWARIAKEAGMKYAVLTTKHHDGFCLFDSQYTDYKATNTKAGRDLVKEYVEAFRAEGIMVGLYYSLLDWHHPDYPAYNDLHHPMRGNEAYKNQGEHFENYVEYMHGQVRELLTNYGKIDIMWFDFSYGEMSAEKWKATELVKMARKINPDIIIDNRMGGDVTAENPVIYAGDFGSPEQMIPVGGMRDVKGNPIPWETCITLNGHWGFDAKDKNYKSARNVINMLMECVSKGGNLLLNVGPDAKGNIPKESIEILQEVGEWMSLNGEAVYGCTMSPLQRPEWGRLTANGSNLYLYIQDCCNESIVLLDCPHKVKKAILLCNGSELSTKEPWNAESYRVGDKKVDFIETPPFSYLNGNGNVIKLILEK
ncbi:MAG: alpha-L-fucosidase [Clostridia bacterium]|nr:alpha-L-fucosidase [Clostridia bacterium]